MGTRLTRGAVAIAAGIVLSAASAAAQQGQPVAAQQTVAFDIPAQDLNAALLLFADRAGLQVFYDTSLVGGLRSSSLRGSFTPQRGLAQLLADTGLTFRLTGGTTVSLERLPPGGAAVNQLDPVQVDGRRIGDPLLGPTDGFIARDALAGTKSRTPVIETPVSVSVIDRNQLDIQNPQSLPDVLRYTPGVATGFFGVDNRMDKGQLRIRGFGDDTAVMFWDGLNLPGDSYINSPSLDPYLLERVEVLRGPASVLYGQASPGGLINAWSKRPTETRLREVVVGTGNYNRAYGAFDIGGPADAEGKFLYRLAGVGYRTGTQIDHTGYERFSIAPSFTWAPTAETRLTFLSSYQRDPEGVGFQSMELEGTLLPSPTGKVPTSYYFGEPSYDRLDRSQMSAGYEFEHRFNDRWAVRQNLRYLHAGGNYREVQPSGWADATNTVMDRWNWATKGQLNSLGVDNQVETRLATGPLQHTVLLGLDYRGQWSNLRHFWSRAGVPPLNYLNPQYGYAIPDPSPLTHTAATLDQTGIYVQDQMAWGNWRFLLGGRQDWAGTSSKNLRAAGTPTTSQRDDAFTWRAGVVYLADNGLAPYASYSTSFQPQSGSGFDGAMFKPTKARQYEIGLKYQPSGLRSFSQVSLFDLTQQNVLTGDPVNPGFSVQTGEVRSRGIELSTTLALTENFNLLASYSYNALETIRANTDGSGFNASGRVPWYYPKQMASVWGDYRFDGGLLAGLRLGGGVRYVGSAKNGPQELYTVPDYTLADLAITYSLGEAVPALGGWEASLNVNNLFDKEYLARCSEMNCSWGIRRTVLANLKVRW